MMSPRKKRYREITARLVKNKSAMIGATLVLIFVILAILAPLIAPYDPEAINLGERLQAPSADHWCGTDDKGRDIFSRLLYGAQLSLTVGVVSVAIGAFFGILLGLLSGYYGGWVDAIIMRCIDVLLAFPGLLLALAIVSALGPGLVNVMIAVGIFSIPAFARIVRGSTLEVKKLEYVEAVKALGANDVRIIMGHILPNIFSPIIVQATLRVASAILTAAGLSFLGLGAQPPTPEWGAMLSDGRSYLWNAPYIATFPGLAISLVVIGFNLFGDGLRDALDPRMKG
ncbi:nickel transporter permease [Rubeoparvulum massiliense]|uniref:nickel transporter permease n=1 Tax=Rubeoparvulum massiliense TaxID=1631346 RepID=UPI000B288517